MVTTYNLYFDDTRIYPYSFELLDDDGKILFYSKQYKTRAAAISVAVRKLNRSK